MQGNPSLIYKSKILGWGFPSMSFLWSRFPVVLVPPGWKVSRSFVFILFSMFGRFIFHKNCGQFISLDSNRTTARRVDSYNHGVVLSETPLPDNHLFQVRC